MGAHEEKILIVDDEDTIRQALSEMMATLGHYSKTAGNGFQALRMLEKEPFFVVISDMEMPCIDGLELIQQVKENFPETEVISITGYGNKYSYTDVITAGATDFITKPFGINEIAAKLNRIIRERDIKNELKKTTEELLKLSIKDDLTGLYNRRHFYTKLEEEMIRSRRQHRSLFLMMFDLDGFKKYNDTYGHIEGDKILKNVAEAIHLSIRKNVDAGFRYGGDEFTIIIPEANQEQALMISGRIRQSCMNLDSHPVDVSIGLAAIQDDYDIETFVSCADRAMYQAKTSKGNKIIIFGQNQ